jgi:hypothetical protein
LPPPPTRKDFVAGADDQVVPGSNAEFLHERLPNAQVDLSLLARAISAAKKNPLNTPRCKSVSG